MTARLASPRARGFAEATAQAIRVYFARENGVAAAQ
jgi:hypothetical protein